MTARRGRRKPGVLTRGEIAELMRRSFIQPLPPPLPLHKIAAARIRQEETENRQQKETR